MANDVFQQVLPEPSATRQGSTSVSPYDYSGLAKVASNIFGNIDAKKKQDALDAKNTFLAGQTQEILSEKNQLAETQRLEQDLLSRSENITQFLKNGIIDENEKERYDAFANDLSKLHAAKRAGLTERDFQTRLNILHSQALASNPKLATEINSLFGFNATDIGQDSQKSVQDAGLLSLAERRFGKGNVGPKEFALIANEQLMSETLTTQQNLGTIDANRLFRDMPVNVSLQARQNGHMSWLKQTSASQAGLISPDQKFEWLSRVDQMRTAGQERFNFLLANSASKGHQISIDQQKALQAQLDKEYDDLAKLADRHDLGAFLEEREKIENLAIERQIPGGFKLLGEIASAVGLGGVQSLRVLAENDELRGRVANMVRPSLEKFNISIDDYLSQALNAIVNFQGFDTARDRAAQALISNTLIKQGAPTPKITNPSDQTKQEAQDAWDALIKASLETAESEVGEINNGQDAAIMYSDRKLARNIMKNGKKEDIQRLENDFVSWYSNIVIDTLRSVDDSNTIVYSQQEKKFIPMLTEEGKKEAERRVRRGTGLGLPRLKQEADRLNKFLDLSRVPEYRTFKNFTEQKVLDFFNEQLIAEETLRKEQEKFGDEATRIRQLTGGNTESSKKLQPLQGNK